MDSSTYYQRFKRLTLLLSIIEIEHFKPQWSASNRILFRENFAIHVPRKYSLDCNKTLFLLQFVIISTPLKLWDITSLKNL